jgi:hypothetical protein
MTEIRLVRHPVPKPTESLQGYLLRLIEVNGYTSLTPILKAAGFTSGELAWTALKLPKLAAITGTSIQTLEKLAYKQEGDDSEPFRLLGHEVLLRDLSLSSSRVCPECIHQFGFIEALWDLDLYVGCPFHKRPSSWYCVDCEKRLPVLRKGMLICRCGASRVNTPTSSLSSETVRLLDLIRYKVLGERLSPDTGTTMPEAELLNLPLKRVLSRIRSLGNYRLRASRIRRDKPTGRDLLHAAAKVLGDWPHGYQHLVADFNPRIYKPSYVPAPPSLGEMMNAIRTAEESRYAGGGTATWLDPLTQVAPILNPTTSHLQ